MNQVLRHPAAPPDPPSVPTSTSTAATWPRVLVLVVIMASGAWLYSQDIPLLPAFGIPLGIWSLLCAVHLLGSLRRGLAVALALISGPTS